MTNRRRFVRAIAGGLLAVPWANHAQQPGKVWRIGYLARGARPSDGAPPAALRQALRELGYVDLANVSFVSRWDESKSERAAGMAAEIVGLKSA